jgi:hypothetical protein
MFRFMMGLSAIVISLGEKLKSTDPDSDAEAALAGRTCDRFSGGLYLVHAIRHRDNMIAGSNIQVGLLGRAQANRLAPVNQDVRGTGRTGQSAIARDDDHGVRCVGMDKFRSGDLLGVAICDWLGSTTCKDQNCGQYRRKFHGLFHGFCLLSRPA